MGLGKTLQAISALSHRKINGAQRFLVVSPASVMTNWIREIGSRSELKVVKIHGSDQKVAFNTWKEVSGVGLTTYDTLKSFTISDSEIFNLQVDTVVVDEAHYIKNAHTGRARTITRWLDRAPNAIFLTGTPMENRVDEFISLANLLDKKVSESLSRAVLAAGPEPFRRAVAPIYLRRNASEVLKELPELIEITDFCDWDGVDRANYVRAVEAGNFMAMRQAAFKGIEGQVPSKLERLNEIVVESLENGKKILIFSFFKSVIEQVMSMLGDKALGPITGATSPSQRQALVDNFQEDSNPRALVGQIQAAGTGLNIQAAQVVIICEPQIKPSLEVQAIARAHRMGQVNKVQVHRLILPDSVDEQMLVMLHRKQQEFDQFARESELANSSVTGKDISDESIARVIISKERERLGLSSQGPIELNEKDE
jgi:SNF2 family DNA or RNA helicase